MFKAFLGALGLLKRDPIEDLRQALADEDLSSDRISPIAERLLKDPTLLMAAYGLLDDHAETHPDEPGAPLWRGTLLTLSMLRGIDPAEPDVVGDARRFLDRAEALGGRATTIRAVREKLDVLLPTDAMTLEMLGTTTKREGWVEKGGQPFPEDAEPAAAAREFAETFCAGFQLAEGSALVRTPHGSFFFLVEGDGRRCRATLVHDLAAQAQFSILFAKVWADVAAQTDRN